MDLTWSEPGYVGIGKSWEENWEYLSERGYVFVVLYCTLD
jgi:hypothetical protein